MHKLVRISMLPVMALGVACGKAKTNDKTAINSDLKRDLEAASATSVELANTSRDYKPTRFVSAIESPATSAPVKHKNIHRPVAKPASAGNGEVAKSPDPAPENKVMAAVPEPSTETPAPAIDTPTNVAVSPRPTPVGAAPATTDAGAGGVGSAATHGGGLGGIGEAIGTIIGVAVIRGGGGGIDHCDPRTDRRPTNGPVSIPNSQGPIVFPPRGGTPPRRPTFPR